MHSGSWMYEYITNHFRRQLSRFDKSFRMSAVVYVQVMSICIDGSTRIKTHYDSVILCSCKILIATCILDLGFKGCDCIGAVGHGYVI